MRLTLRKLPLESHVASSPRVSDDPEQSEDGYFSVMLALMIIPLMIFAALAVDLGFWYTRAMEIQRAADAAALAGVVWMPNDFTKAEATAVTTATRNTLPPGAGDVTVVAQRVTGQSRQLDVTITDPHVRTFFGAVLFDEISITRTARARYVLPVPLGSPLNSFGNQNLTPTADDPKLWAAINAPYALHESGDPFAPKCAGAPSSTTSCEDGTALSNKCDPLDPGKPCYRTEGYRYIVEVPSGSAGRTLTVETLDGVFFPRGSYTSQTGDGFDHTTARDRMALEYELFEADSTPFDISDNPSMSGGRCTSGPGRRTLSNEVSTSTDGWFRLCRQTAKEGQYVLTVKSSAIPGASDQGNGSNQYSLRATLSGAGLQPKVYAFADMSVLTNYTGSAGDRANNYLAEVEPLHAGKKLIIELFDAGDGRNGQFDLSILAPDGTIPNCKWNSPGPKWNQPGAWPIPALNNSGTCTIRTRNNGTPVSNNLYNDRWLAIEIQLPTSYTCNASLPTPPVNPGPGVSTGCWWRLSYLFGGTDPTPTDRTTWKVRLIGDPVQLIR